MPFPQIRGRIHQDRLSPASIALYKDWLRTCDQSHTLCHLAQDAFYPRRLLDVGISGRNRQVRLCEPGGEAIRYLALSYCWGDKVPLKTLRSNLADHERAIPWATLPKSFQDIAALSRKLGVRYLWIDSLCIVQDDNVERDVEIARMHDIFRHALLVIIAAEASNPYAGFLEASRVPPSDRVRSCWIDFVVHYRELELNTVKIRKKPLVHCAGQDTDACGGLMRIGKRAWTYQERLLARRCLVFHNVDVVWECSTVCYCECSGDRSAFPGRQYRPQLLPSPVLQRQQNPSPCTAEKHFACADDAYDFWKRAIRSFSSRGLSRDTDRLPAISALATIIQQHTGDEYLAGLWRGDLASQLMWYNWPSYSSLKPYKSYTAPSWSWAATSAPTCYILPRDHTVKQPKQRTIVEIVDAVCVLAGANPFGPVLDGYIILRGIHCSAYATVVRNSETGTAQLELKLETGEFHVANDGDREFHFFDGLRVGSMLMDIGPCNIDTTLQRTGQSTDEPQDPCSGEVRLLWVEEYSCLVL